MKTVILLLTLLPAFTQAAGAWHASTSGPGVQNRGMQVTSQALTASEQVEGAITEVAWRYQLTGPAPSGLVVHLCAEKRCVPIEGASGITRGLSNLAANQAIWFVYGVQGRGRLPQEVRALSNQVMVNYH